MKTNMVLVVYVFVVLTILSMNLRTSQVTSRVTFQKSSIADYHQQWMIQFSRNYSNELEKQMRLDVFKKNLEYIENFNNNGNQSYKLGVNQFTDLTQEEFLATHTGLRGINVTSPSELVARTKPHIHYALGESKDWRTEGAVTPVKQQGGCGSCWTFSVIAAVEGLTKIVQGKLVPLSEQQVLDCDKVHNNGCHGGTVTDAFDYIAKNGGISSEDAYPYKMKKGSCMSGTKPAMKIRGYERVPSNNETALLEAVWRQPVSVCIDTLSESFKHYSEGVYDATDSGNDVNHAVTIVGFGTSKEGMKYWLAKNSWGNTWGENGYIRLRRDVEWPQGMCGLAQFASYPVA